MGVPGLIWSGYLMLAIYVRFFDPWYSLYWVAGFLASSFILWLVLFVGDTIRHALSPAAAGRKGTSSG